jgi:membrane protease YdiL (CAAX protease family)
MNTITSAIKRHPILTFFVLAYTFSWLPWVLGTLVPASRPFVLYPFLGGGPLLAALIVIPITQGRAGLRAWAASLLKWRVGWRWYVVAIGIPLTVALGAAALNGVFGAPSLSLAQILGANGDARDFNAMLGIGPLLSLILVFALRLINPADGPLGEEPGWRGYALPGLQATRSPLAAALMVGLLAAGWHLPIIFVGAASPFELLAPFSLGIVSCWVYNRTGGSLLLSLMLHAADGMIQIERLGFVGADAERMVWLYSGLWCAMAIGIVILSGLNLGRQAATQGKGIATPVAAH